MFCLFLVLQEILLESLSAVSGAPRLTVLKCDQTIVWATLKIVCSEEVGQSLQGRVRFLLRVRLQHGDNPGCSTGTFSARRRRMGIFAVAQLEQFHN